MGTIQSPNALILMDSNPITGCLDYNLDSTIDLFGAQNLGNQLVSNYVKESPTTHNLDLSWVFSPYSADIYLGGRSSINSFFSSGKHNFIIRDTVEQQLISGAYLKGFGLEVAVGEIPKFSASFDCDTVNFNNQTLNTVGVDTLEGEIGIFSPRSVQVNNLNLTPFLGDGSGCIQSVNLSVDIPRVPIRRLGTRIPQTRAIRENPKIQVSVSAFKDALKNPPSNYLNEAYQNTGQMKIFFDTIPKTDQFVVVADGLTLASINDSLGTDGRDAITYNYEGSFNDNSFSIAYGTSLLELSVNALITESGSYTVVGWPNAIAFSGLIYVGSIRGKGEKQQEVWSITEDGLTVNQSPTLRTSNQEDDHNAPFLAINPTGGTILAQYLDHASADNNVYLKESTSLAVSSFAAVSPITFTSLTPTYAHPHLDRTNLNRLDTVTRRVNAATAHWDFYRTENYKTTPPTQIPLFDGCYVFLREDVDGDGYWFVCAGSEGQMNGAVNTEKSWNNRVVLSHLRKSDLRLTSGGVEISADITTLPNRLMANGHNWLSWTDSFTETGIWSRLLSTVISTAAFGNRFGVSGGSVSVRRLQETGGSGTHRTQQIVGVRSTAGKYIEVSCFVKSDNRKVIDIWGIEGTKSGVQPQIKFDATAGEFIYTEGVYATFKEEWLNGWWRCGYIYYSDTDSTSLATVRIYLALDDGTVTYSGVSTTGLLIEGAQVCEAHPDLDQLRPYHQVLTTNYTPSTQFLTIIEPYFWETNRIMDFIDDGTDVLVLYCKFDTFEGVKWGVTLANGDPLTGEIRMVRYNKTTHAVTDELIGTAGDGVALVVAPVLGSGLHGGAIMDAGTYPLVVVDQKNYLGDGVPGRLTAYRKTPWGWRRYNVLQSATEVLMRPMRVYNVETNGTRTPTDFFVYQQGQYQDYQDDFDTSLRLAKIVT